MLQYGGGEVSASDKAAAWGVCAVSVVDVDGCSAAEGSGGSSSL